MSEQHGQLWQAFRHVRQDCSMNLANQTVTAAAAESICPSAGLDAWLWVLSLEKLKDGQESRLEDSLVSSCQYCIGFLNETSCILSQTQLNLQILPSTAISVGLTWWSFLASMLGCMRMRFLAASVLLWKWSCPARTLRYIDMHCTNLARVFSLCATRP